MARDIIGTTGLDMSWQNLILFYIQNFVFLAACLGAY